MEEVWENIKGKKSWSPEEQKPSVATSSEDSSS